MKEEDYVKVDEEEEAWGTWEELLLACAVKRHGFKNWDSVATEVRSRSDVIVSANNCKQKYRDLKLRFHRDDDEEEENVPWLDELRSLRVEELRREVERYDVSILSLQLKVKKLEEERRDDEKPDLEDERKTAKAAEEEEEEEENRSMNESNSTEKIVDENPDRDLKEGSELSHSDELGESGTSERKWKMKQSEDDNHDGDGGEIRSMVVSKSEPLINLLDLIRSHPRGSLFERRLRSQVT